MARTERLFFALWPTSAQQKAWATRAAECLPAGSGRLLRAANLHITLVYIGEVSGRKRQALEAMADEISFSPFTLRLDVLGYWCKPKVWWWGPSQTPVALSGLVQSLAAGAMHCGIEIEQRSYRAHMTLARKVARAPGEAVIQPCDWRVEGFALVRSVSSTRGVCYEPLRHWPGRLVVGPGGNS